MQPQDAELLRDILTTPHHLALAVLVDEAPYAGLLPFVVAADFTALYVHASDLAKHSKGLGTGDDYAAVLHLAERAVEQPLQVPRLSVQGVVTRVERGSAEYDAARALYTARITGSADLFEMADFNIYRLALDKGRFVLGFARTLNVSRKGFADLVG